MSRLTHIEEKPPEPTTFMVPPVSKFLRALNEGLRTILSPSQRGQGVLAGIWIVFVVTIISKNSVSCHSCRQEWIRGLVERRGEDENGDVEGTGDQEVG